MYAGERGYRRRSIAAPKRWVFVGWIYGTAHTDDYSLKIVNTAATNANWRGEIITFPSPFPHTVTLGGWAKAEDVAPGGNFAIDFYIEFEDGTYTW